MGHVYRPKGRHVWNLKYYHYGKAIYESAKTTIKDEAVRLLRKREGDIAAGLAAGKPGRLRGTEAFEAVVRDYTLNRRRSHSELAYRIRLHLTPAFGGRLFGAVTSRDVAAYVDGRRLEGAANATINRELAILKRAFTLAMRAGTLTSRPHIPMLDEHNARTGFFEAADLEALCAHLPAPLRPVMRCAYYTGWRIQSELLPLTWDRVDDEAMRLDPGTTKNQAGRAFPYAGLPPLAEVIAGQRAARLLTPSVYVFPNETGGIQSRWFTDKWQRACIAAGLSGRIPHDFRRTAVRNLVRAGVSEKTAMLLTGHKTRSVFDRYDIITYADLQVAVARLR